MISQKYDENSISTLEGLEAVRRRPGMYIGNTSTEGLHHLALEIIDNAVDEALANECKNIIVKISDKRRICVRDDGRGIPTKIKKGTQKSALEIVFTELHAGAKFENSAYKVSGGLHGVGSAVVNALSEFVDVQVFRDGHRWHQRFENSTPVAPCEKLEETNQRGTLVVFQPDFSRFDDSRFDAARIRRHLKERSYLVPDTRFVLVTETSYDEFYSARGVLDLLETKLKSPQIPPVDLSFEGIDSEYRVVFAIENTEAERITSYANGIRTHDGGSHVSVFRAALSKAISMFAHDHSMKADAPVVEEFRRGLIAIIDTRLSEPQFEGQTKAKLRNASYAKMYQKLLTTAIKQELEKQSKAATKLLQDSIVIAKKKKKAREEISDMKKRLRKHELQMSAKLDDCSSRKTEERELFIVEGDSAGGSLKKCKNNKTQAVLPLRGKTLNVERADKETRVYKNEALISITAALGLSFENPDYSRLRYSKLIIMTDADADGNHITILLLGFLYTYFPKLFELGVVYLPVPPLYRVTFRRKSQYLVDDRALNKYMATCPEPDKVITQRFKGLGEMNPEQLWETCVDPSRRLLIQVDATNTADVQDVLHIALGSDAAVRREYIRENASLIDDEFIMMM